ncbi:MAG: flagellar basal body-associated FliL family protein [Proteobacteria bacterium]|nr:flagellar basal body-associated FliL family protein [Pseudomonadota bacterium]
MLASGSSALLAARSGSRPSASPSSRPGSTSSRPPVTTFEPFVVNLDEPGTSRYLKVTLQLELATGEVMHKFEKAKELVRDAIFFQEFVVQ